MHKPKKSRKLLWIILAVVVAVLAVGGLLLYRTGVISGIFRSKDIVARVGTHNITKQEVQKTSEDAIKAGFRVEKQTEIRDLIMNYWLSTLAAQEYDLKVSDNEAIDYFKLINPPKESYLSYDINNSYVRYRAYSSILQSKIADIIANPGTGTYVIAHFEQNLLRDTPELKALTDAQYNALVAADKKYATDFINDIYSQLKSGKIDMNKAMQIEIDNPVIGKKPLPTSVHSSSFGQLSKSAGGVPSYTIATSQQFKEKTKNLKAGELSEPFIMQLPIGFKEDGQKVDAYWLIVKMDKDNSKGPKFGSTNEAIEYFKKKYGYEIYN